MRLRQPRTRQDAIQQIGKRLRAMVQGFRARMDEELKPRHCTLSQLRLLHELRENPDLSGAGLARACGVTPQSAQAMLVRAVERGWAVRSKGADNERLLTARLTRAGERLLDHAQAVKTRIEAEIWAGTPLEELRQMNVILTRVLANLEP